MIQLKISGRLGNQMFQYAVVQDYIKKNNIKDQLIITTDRLNQHKTDKDFKVVLDKLGIKDYKLSSKTKMTFKQFLIDFIYKVIVKIIRINAKIHKRKLQKKDWVFFKKFMQKMLNKNGLYYYIPTMNKFYDSKSENIIFFGLFESMNLMNECDLKKLRKLYVVKNTYNEADSKLFDIIKSEESICVTIRRGDFLIPEFRGSHYICTPEYFTKAIETMNRSLKSEHKEPRYIVFSDDVEWCKNNMVFPDNTLYESGKNTLAQKIEMMSSCKNFIISNSTFSWWVQQLSENENKKVIAPKKWNNFSYCDDLYSKDWILI